MCVRELVRLVELFDVIHCRKAKLLPAPAFPLKFDRNRWMEKDKSQLRLKMKIVEK